MYRQYQNESSTLARDISRLNNQLVTARRRSRNVTNIVPLAITSDNANRKRPIAITQSKATDTLYVTDTVKVLERDTVNAPIFSGQFNRDTVTVRSDTVTHNTDTVIVNRVLTEHPFDYSSMPEEIILFNLGKSNIEPIYHKRLNFISQILKNDPQFLVHITGHTDSSGSRTINERLSFRRAVSVADYLIEKGVSKSQIIIKAVSFDEPAIPGNSNIARSQNRRATVKLVRKGQ